MTVNQYLKGIRHGGFKSFLRRAQELGIGLELVEHEHTPILKLTYKRRSLFCYKRNMPIFRRMGNLTKNKVITKLVLESVGIRTPKGVVATSLEATLAGIRKEKLRYPLIVKPVDGSLAKGVTWNIRSEKALAAAVQHSLSAYGKREGVKVLIEEMFIGNEFRVLVFNGRVLSCVEKIAAGVTGDGASSIEQLVHAFNRTRRQGFKLRLDSVALQSLREAGYTLETVLPAGRFFPFRHNLNMSDGGRSIDRTREMSPELKSVCVRAIEAVGLTYGGLDLITKNIEAKRPAYVILEVNPNPFYNMHEKPLVEGPGVDVSHVILKSLFPALPAPKSSR